MKEWTEKDPEGLGPDLRFKTQVDEHEGHEVEASETLYDNALEYTRWGYCLTCNKEVMLHSQEVADWDAWLSEQEEDNDHTD